MNKGEPPPDASGDADPARNGPTATEGTHAGLRAPATEADNEPASTLQVLAGRGRGGPRCRHAEREASLEPPDGSPNPKGREPKGAVPDTDKSEPEGARADTEEELGGAREAPEEAATPEEAAAAPKELAEPEGAAAFRTLALPARAVAAT